MDYSIRALTKEDEAIVWKMLMYASHQQSVKAVQQLPNISRYAEGWCRTGDIGSVAFANELLIGAAWLRLWSNHDQGFGYIDPSIPAYIQQVKFKIRYFYLSAFKIIKCLR